MENIDNKTVEEVVEEASPSTEEVEPTNEALVLELLKALPVHPDGPYQAFGLFAVRSYVDTKGEPQFDWQFACKNIKVEHIQALANSVLPKPQVVIEPGNSDTSI